VTTSLAITVVGAVVGVAVGAPGAVQQELNDGLALQASAKSGLVQ